MGLVRGRGAGDLPAGGGFGAAVGRDRAGCGCAAGVARVGGLDPAGGGAGDAQRATVAEGVGEVAPEACGGPDAGVAADQHEVVAGGDVLDEGGHGETRTGK